MPRLWNRCGDDPNVSFSPLDAEKVPTGPADFKRWSAGLCLITAGSGESACPEFGRVRPARRARRARSRVDLSSMLPFFNHSAANFAAAGSSVRDDRARSSVGRATDA
jgi:hypothetical protein